MNNEEFAKELGDLAEKIGAATKAADAVEHEMKINERVQRSMYSRELLACATQIVCNASGIQPLLHEAAVSFLLTAFQGETR